MSLVNVRSHTRGGKNRTVAVKAYTQSRKTGKPRKKKGYTACQSLIAQVYNLNNKHNATREQLRNDPAWRNYVCNCSESSHWDWIVNQGDSQPPPIKATPTDYTVRDVKGRTQTFRARIINLPSKTVQSRCGVSIFIPAFKRTLQGKSIAFLKASNKGG